MTAFRPPWREGNRSEAEAVGKKAFFSLRTPYRFVLHHILGYTIKETAVMARITEKECRAHLRNAYLQLASSKIGSKALVSTANAHVARAWAEYEFSPSGI